MKHIFTYKNKYYGYKVLDGNVENYEILNDHGIEEVETIANEDKLTDEEWEYIINELSDNEQGV